jgi:phosphomevalonate kinase
VPITGAHKTGLGSSAALVTSLTASLLTHYLPSDVFDVQSPDGKKILHNLAQAAHCAAQGKIGSGFDVAAAVYGSSLYRRFSPETLGSVPEPGAPGFGDKLVEVVGSDWDVEVQKEGLAIPDGIGLRMADVDCGSESVGMAKKVLSWKAADLDRAVPLWTELQRRNETLAQSLRDGKVDELPAKLNSVRELIREMGQLSDVPIEPESQTELLDAASGVDGVYGGVVPGAGGYDAVVLVMKNDEATLKRVEEFLAGWSKEKQTNVKLLPVEGEMEGIRKETLDLYDGWL